MVMVTVGTVTTTTLVDRTVTLLPNVRSRLVRFRASGLRPLSRHFLFIEGEPVFSYAREETLFVPFSRNLQNQYLNVENTSHPIETTNLVSDASGQIIGSMLMPNNDSLRFAAGEIEVKLLDISVDDDAEATSSARTTYFSQGTLTRQEWLRTVITTVREQDRREPETQADRDQRDPLAQSFNIQNSVGCFITSIEVYFSTKPTSGADAQIPVKLEVRPLRNGVPSQNEVMPGSFVQLSPSEVSIPSDLNDLTAVRAAPTKFTFDQPIFLEGNTPYAFVLMADTNAYNVYVAETAAFVLGTTERRIRQQPSLGSLFLSQNAQTWTPDQTRDMMFKINRASFVSSGTAIIGNVDVPDTILASNPILTDSGSSTITINHRGHGLGVNDAVYIKGLDSADTVGGISGASILGRRVVTAIDGNGFQVTADSSATSSSFGGGTGLSFTDNIQMDQAQMTIPAFEPSANTRVNLLASFAKGRSIVPQDGDGTSAQNSFAVSANTSFGSLDRIDFIHPQVIASRHLEDSSPTLLGAGTPRRSVQITASMSTTSDFVSPVINAGNCTILSTNNLIDYQDSASGTFPLNVPLSYVDETSSRGGSHLSKHLTNPITLEQPAVGLKIIIAANRPSVAEFDVYYRVVGAGSDTVIDNVAWTITPRETLVQSDENPRVFRDYEYTVGGLGGQLDPFTTFQLKIVMKSSNSSLIPMFKDLRVIALGT